MRSVLSSSEPNDRRNDTAARFWIRSVRVVEVRAPSSSSRVSVTVYSSGVPAGSSA